MDGYGPVKLVNARWNVPEKAAGDVELTPEHTVAPRLGGRSYFADACTEGIYASGEYMALKLLGKTIKFTVDMSGAGCGCNVAFYLTSMQQNTEVSDCSDYYCDANSVCGVACAEIDIMEANKFAWHSTLHASDDKSGVGKGFGGGDGWNGARDWNSADYGPQGKCVDTTQPFEVEASFPVDNKGQLKGMEVTLTQEGRSCPLSVAVDQYDGMEGLSRALAAGMTPIISYWSSDEMLWLDGQGEDKKGPCPTDDAKSCGTAKPALYGFSVEGPGVPQMGEADGPAKECPGTTSVAGVGQISLVNARWNKPGSPAGKVDVLDGSIVAHMTGRTYFGNGCAPGAYSNAEYAALRLLGKTFRYSVDLSAASCGCNAALYLTSLQQNWHESECSDYYCDANKVCGVRCAEIDIMEANKVSFYSTLHVRDDGGGVGKGYGAARFDWNASVYGPGARCIDTSLPFQVSSSFPVDAEGKLTGMEVKLSQQGKSCPLSVLVNTYKPFGRDGLSELSEALKQGMTPIISYWGEKEDMSWMDGQGPTGKGPCEKEEPGTCGATIRFSDFAVESISEASSAKPVTFPPTLPPIFPPTPAPVAWTTPRPPGRNTPPPNPGAQGPGPYDFVGYYRPEAARYACGAQRRLAAPKTAEQQLALRLALAREVRAGRLTRSWPNNTVWIGGHWNAMESTWEWDDGERVGALNWAVGQPSATGGQLREPWLCMVQDGTFHDSDPPYNFGVFCEPASGPQASAHGSNLMEGIAATIDADVKGQRTPASTPAPMPAATPAATPAPAPAATPAYTRAPVPAPAPPPMLTPPELLPVATLLPPATTPGGPTVLRTNEGESVIVQIHTPLPRFRIDQLIMKKDSHDAGLASAPVLGAGLATTAGLALLAVAAVAVAVVRGQLHLQGVSRRLSRTAVCYSQLIPGWADAGPAPAGAEAA